MPGFTRRSKPLKGTVQLTDLSNFAITNASESDLIVYDSGTGNWVNRKSLTGDYSISGSLTVNSIVLSDGITLGSNIAATGNLDIGGNADIDGTLVVGGTTTLAAVNASGNATIGGTLGVTGTLTGSAFSFSGNGTVGGNLTVTGTLSVGTYSVTDLSASGDVAITGYLTVGDFLNVAGNITAANINGAAVGGTTLSSAGTITGAGDLDISGIGWSNSAGDVTAQLTTYDGTYTIKGRESVGLTDVTMLILDPVGATTLHYAGAIAALTDSVGFNSRRTTGGTTVHRLQDSSGTNEGGFFSTTSSVYMYSYNHGGLVQLWGEDAGGTGQKILEGNPDGATGLYHDGGLTFATRADGQVELTGVAASANPAIWFVDSTNADLSVFYHEESTNTGIWSGRKAGALMDLRSRNAGDTAYHSIFSGDPDGALKLYANNQRAIDTLASATGNGARFIAESVNNRNLIEFYNNAVSTRQGFIWLTPDGNKLEMRNEVNSDHVVLAGKTAAAATFNLMWGDPDTGVAFNGASAGVTAPTYTPTNVVTDRSYDANSTTTAELADVLGTLIADLQAIGLLQ